MCERNMVKCGVNRFEKNRYVWKNVRQPGIEPGSIAWKATMLTFTPPTLDTCGKIADVYKKSNRCRIIVYLGRA